MNNVYVYPPFDDPDKGDGGIRRVVEAQKKYLPLIGYNVVSSEAEADIIAVHGGSWVESNKPIVSHCHGLYWHEADYDWAKWATSLNEDVLEAIRRADITTAPSKWVARSLQRGAACSAPVLYHGIEPLDWPVDANINDGYVLWNKTRVDPICDPTPVMELAKMAPDIKFLTTFGEVATSNIRVTGRLSFEDAKQFIQHAGIYLCTARETFGIGTLEAMVCGVPVLGWAWGGQREIIEHRETGYLAKPGDFNDLLNGLRYCIEHRERLGKAAREHVLKHFTWDKVIQAYKPVYDSLLLLALQKESNPKISVIITCYNLAEYVTRAIKSVQNQTIDPTKVEILVVNDASPDNTTEIVQALQISDPRIKLIVNDTNQYLAGALNIGIKAARGKYIVPLDADNELASTALELMSNPLDKNRDLDITYGAMEVVQEDNSRFISTWPPRTIQVDNKSHKFDYLSQMNHRNQITSTAMYRKSVWTKIGGYRRRCKTAEDADFWCRAVSWGANPAHVTDAPTLIYYDRHDSMSHTVADWAWNEWYPWYKWTHLTPYIVKGFQGNVRSFEPSKITVVIPVGPNPTHSVLLHDAIDSIIGQTYQRWDIIVVDDSGLDSIDPTEFPPFVQFLKTSGRQGPAVARNVGIAASVTPLWIPLDADDYLQPTALELLIKAHVPNTYVYSDWIIQETGKIQESHDYDCDEIRNHLPHAVTALYEKGAWERVGGFDKKIIGWEDWDFIIALANIGVCGTRVSVPLLQYRMEAGTHREEIYAEKDKYLLEIRSKWPQYLIEKRPIVACGSCGGNRSPVVTSNRISIPNESDPSMVLLEFIGSGGARSYVGQVTGTIYRFGSDPSHKIRYVFASDLPLFVNRPEFRRAVPLPVDVDNTLLQAASK